MREFPMTDVVAPLADGERKRARRPVGGRVRWLARNAIACYWIAVLLAVPGLIGQDPLYLAFASLVASFGFVLSDVSRTKFGGTTAITSYSVSAIMVAIGNIAALLAAETPHRPTYFIYVFDRHIPLAMELALAASIIPVLGFRVAMRGAGHSLLFRSLPLIRFRANDRHLVVGGLLLAAASIAFRVIAGSTSSLGTIWYAIYFAPHFVAFALARAGWQRRIPGAVPAAMAIALAESYRALLFDYLRADIVAPFVAFTLGSLLGSRSFRPLRSAMFVPVYVAAAAFVIYFAAFGRTRSVSATGMQRLADLQEQHEFLIAQEAPTRQTMLSRFSLINQLSQIGRVVEEDGFLHGETLEYLAFAFVPRVVWPEKPAIAKGAWFALRIGQANVTRSGQIVNSINMTIPGELYLNFGWLGVFVGLFFFGWFIALLWSRTDFWGDSRNVLGSAFGYYLFWIWLGFSMGADLQIVVTLIALYILFVAPSIWSRLQRRGA